MPRGQQTLNPVGSKGQMNSSLRPRVFFRDISTERLRHGVLELSGAVDKYIAHYNTKPNPFI